MLEKYKWKEYFLMKIEESGILVMKFVYDNEYRIIGLPLFGKDSKMVVIEENIKKKINRR